MDDDITRFVRDVLDSHGDACACPAAVAVSFGGDAVAEIPAPMDRIAGQAQPTPGVAVAGRTGDAGAVAISVKGDATASARAGNGSAPRVGQVTTASVTTASITTHRTIDLRTDVLYRSVQHLAAGVLDANTAARGLSPMPALAVKDRLTPVSVEVVEAGDDDCAARDACSFAIALAVNGTVHAASAQPSRCGGGSGVATTVAVAFAGDARAGPVRDAQPATCGGGSARSGLVAAIAGDTGRALGVSISADGPARASAESGDLGVVAAPPPGTASKTGVVAISGSSGDSTSVAVGEHAASADVVTGNTGDAAARCTTCGQAIDGATRAVSGDTGDSFSLAGAGLDATATSLSGSTGDATAAASGPKNLSAGAQKGYHGGTVTGRSGDTGDAFAGAVDPSTEVAVDTRTGISGFVTSTTTGPHDSDGIPGGMPGRAPVGVHVGESENGSRSIRIGHHHETNTVPPARGTTSHGTRKHDAPPPSAAQPDSSSTSAPPTSPPSRATAARQDGPPARQAAEPQHGRLTSAGDRGSRSTAAIAVTSGAIFFSLAALLTAVVRWRRRRARR